MRPSSCLLLLSPSLRVALGVYVEESRDYAVGLVNLPAAAKQSSLQGEEFFWLKQSLIESASVFHLRERLHASF